MASRRALALAAAILLGAGCQKACGGERADPKASLVLGTIGEPDTLDPIFAQSSGAIEIARLLFRDLTQHDDAWRIVPGLAAELPTASTTTSGAMRVDWTLAPGLSWSDGHPLGSEDVAFGHRIEIDPTLEVRSLEYASRIQRVEIHDPRRFTVVWKNAIPDYASPQVHPILPAHAYPDPKTSPRPFAGLTRAPIASGPYRLLRWIPGQQLELEPNPHWPGPKPEIERLVWRFFASEDALEPALVTGGIDALGEASGLSTERARALAERLKETHVLHLTDSGVWLHLDLRLDDPIAGRLEVRQAIDRAIDRRAIVDLAYEGAAEPAAGCFPPRHLAYAGVKERGLDLAAANALIDRAGLARPISLRMLYAAGSAPGERAATVLKWQLEKIGIELELESAPMSAIFDRMKKKTHPPLVLYAWRVRPDWYLASVLHTGGAQNYTGVSDPALDRALDSALAASSTRAWAEALQAAERRYVELLPAIPLVFRKSASLRPRWVDGWRPTGATTPVTWNAELWRVRREPTQP